MNSESGSENDAMKLKAMIKSAVDIFMTLAMLFLMGYHLWGDAAHEWMGAGMLVLFIVHHILNGNWHKTLFRGKYSMLRIVMLVIDILLLVSMLAQMYSGIVMSRHVFAFLPIDGGMALARRLHILGAYWGFILMNLHLGLHWNMILRMTRKAARIKSSPKIRRIIACIAGLAMAGYGAWVFIRRDFLTYMFLRSEFVFLDYDEPVWSFYADYICLMGLWVFLAHFAAKGIRRSGGRTKAAAEKA